MNFQKRRLNADMYFTGTRKSVLSRNLTNRDIWDNLQMQVTYFTNKT